MSYGKYFNKGQKVFIKRIFTDEEQVARIRADMQNKSLGSRYIDMSKLYADVQQSRENRLMPEYIEKEEVSVVRYKVGLGEWKRAAVVG